MTQKGAVTMAKRTRRNHGRHSSQVAVSVRGEQTLSELAQRFQVIQSDHDVEKQLWQGARVFDKDKKHQEPDTKELHAKIGKLTMENDFYPSARAHRRRAQGNDQQGASIATHKTVPTVELSRSGIYYSPVRKQ